MGRTRRKDNNKGKHPVLFMDSIRKREVPMKSGGFMNRTEISVTLVPVSWKEGSAHSPPSGHLSALTSRGGSEVFLSAVNLGAWAFLIRKLLPTPF